MRRDQFDHLIRAVGHILGRSEVIVIGSQSIPGAVPELDHFPEALVKSNEVDFLPLPDPDETLADRIDAFLGELSQFHETHGVYPEGVGAGTAKLPSGWEERLIRYETEATGGVRAMCLEPHDLAVAKLIAGREHDYNFCRALVSSGMVSITLVEERLATTPEVDPAAQSRVRSWLGAQEAPDLDSSEVDQQRALDVHRVAHENDDAGRFGDIGLRRLDEQGRGAQGT